MSRSCVYGKRIGAGRTLKDSLNMQQDDHQYYFEVVVTGRDFHTQLIRPAEVAKVITSVEKMIRAIVARDNPQLDIGENELVVGLSSVTQSELKNTFITPYEHEVSRAVELTARAINEENFAPIPVESIKAIKELRTFNKATRTATELRQGNGTYARLAELKPTTRIRVQSFILRNRTTMYGTLSRIGGYDPPRAYMRFLDGTKFSCRVQDVELSHQMAQHLYQIIGVRGVAHWDIRNMLLHDFRIEELMPYTQTPLTEAMNGLQSVIGEYYEEIEDVRSYIANQRDNDE